MEDKRTAIRKGMQALEALRLGEFQPRPNGIQRDKFMVFADMLIAYRLTNRPGAKGGFLRMSERSLLMRAPSPALQSLILTRIPKKPWESEKGIEYGINELDHSDISMLFQIISDFACPQRHHEHDTADRRLLEFEHSLEVLIGRPSDMRPFVCDGSPLDAEVFIVGFNPATQLEFWRFWESGTGFAKSRWKEAYRQSRLAAGKKRLKSNTRSMIDWIIEDLPEVKVVETNIYSTASNASADLAAHARISAPFRFLLREIKPKVILAHGAEAVAETSALMSELDLSSKLIPATHFRKWGRDKAQEYAHQVLRALYGQVTP